MRMRIGIALLVLGGIAWAALGVWTFGYGHSNEPVALPWQIGTVVIVFGPLLLGTWLVNTRSK